MEHDHAFPEKCKEYEKSGKILETGGRTIAVHEIKRNHSLQVIAQKVSEERERANALSNSKPQ